MISDLDIWRSAIVMVKRYGDDAIPQAAFYAYQRLYEGDRAGIEIWHHILITIACLQAKAPAEGEAVH